MLERIVRKDETAETEKSKLIASKLENLTDEQFAEVWQKAALVGDSELVRACHSISANRGLKELPSDPIMAAILTKDYDSLVEILSKK